MNYKILILSRVENYEIEDNSPHMNIEKLDENLKREVLDYYVKGIYSYIDMK